jgi:mRNA-degrading endonuclease RelE of RelBE toxin-antitoxin system/DNA-binding XRE family transcriptional regulator
VAIEIVFYRRSLKELRAMPKAECGRVLQRLQAYASDSDNPHLAVPTLAGQNAISRLRVGDWRILFDKLESTIEIRTIRPRRESYAVSSGFQDDGAAEREAEGSEDAFDSALADLARAEQANQETVPIEIVQRLSDGGVPVAVWREHCSQSQELAEAARIPPELLVEIENGKEDVPLRIMHAIASALRVDLDDLVPWSTDGGDVTEVALTGDNAWHGSI